MKQPQTKEQYIEQLRAALLECNANNIDDIIEDYEEYFAHSAARGYSVKESIERLPSIQKLAQSYRDGVDETESESIFGAHASSAKRILLFTLMILGEILFLPFLGLIGLFLGCIAVAGLAAIVGGILVPIPQEALGSITVPHPPIWYVLPTMVLLIGGGMGAVGLTLVATERMYCALRMAILTKRRILTGNRGGYLKLVPPISKQLKRILYSVVLFSILAAIIALFILAVMSSLTTGSSDFIRVWGL